MKRPNVLVRDLVGALKASGGHTYESFAAALRAATGRGTRQYVHQMRTGEATLTVPDLVVLLDHVSDDPDLQRRLVERVLEELDGRPWDVVQRQEGDGQAVDELLELRMAALVGQVARLRVDHQHPDSDGGAAVTESERDAELAVWRSIHRLAADRIAEAEPRLVARR